MHGLYLDTDLKLDKFKSTNKARFNMQSKSEITKCDRCKISFSWSDYEWDYFMVKGYRSKQHKCQCGNSPSLHEPFGKDEKAFWNDAKEKLNRLSHGEN